MRFGKNLLPNISDSLHIQLKKKQYYPHNQLLENLTKNTLSQSNSKFHEIGLHPLTNY